MIIVVPVKLVPDLVEERYRLLLRHVNLQTPQTGTRPAIGIPMALSNYELLPLWGTLLQELGFSVVLSPRSTRRIIRRGVETVVSTPCFPIKVAHGHVFHLLDQGVDFLWLPSLLIKLEGMAHRYSEVVVTVNN